MGKDQFLGSREIGFPAGSNKTYVVSKVVPCPLCSIPEEFWVVIKILSLPSGMTNLMDFLGIEVGDAFASFNLLGMGVFL